MARTGSGDRGIEGDRSVRDWPLERVPTIILASQSIARRELLESVGVHVLVEPTYCDESTEQKDPVLHPRQLARRKMEAFLRVHPTPSLPVLTCDTIVEFRGEILGKPLSYEQAYRYIEMLSGAVHQVVSAFDLFIEGKLLSGYESAQVEFNRLSSDQIKQHLLSIDYLACAGAYRVQQQRIEVVKRIIGSNSTVVGLPLEAISDILGEPASCKAQEYPPHGEK